MTSTASVDTRPRDPKFAKVGALMRSTEHVGEKAAARDRADAMAAAAGMTLDEAMSVGTAPKQTRWTDIRFQDSVTAGRRTAPIEAAPGCSDLEATADW